MGFSRDYMSWDIATECTQKNENLLIGQIKRFAEM